MIACYKNEINVREGQEEKINWFQTSLVAQIVERLSTMWETQVRSLDREDPLEKEMAIHSSTPAWKIPWMEDPGRLRSMGSQRVGHDWATSLSLLVAFIGEPSSKIRFFISFADATSHGNNIIHGLSTQLASPLLFVMCFVTLVKLSLLSTQIELRPF